MKSAFGVDIGGTNIKIGLVSAGGTLQKRWEMPTDTRDSGRFILRDIAGILREILSHEGIPAGDMAGIGLAIPGPVERSGIVNHCLNLGWARVNASKELRELTGLPVLTGNDGAMAAWGEMWQGAAKAAETFVMLTLGTGVGGGIVINRRPLAGHDGSAGEVGHILINSDEERACVCGNRGCMEQYGSARALETAAADCIARNPDAETTLKRGSLSAKDVMAAAMQGDALAGRLVDTLCEALGKGTGILGTIVNPELFIIGGGLAQAGPFLLGKIREAYRRYAFHSARQTPFALARLGKDAAVYGCARAVLEPGFNAI